MSLRDISGDVFGQQRHLRLFLVKIFRKCPKTSQMSPETSETSPETSRTVFGQNFEKIHKTRLRRLRCLQRHLRRLQMSSETSQTVFGQNFEKNRSNTSQMSPETSETSPETSKTSQTVFGVFFKNRHLRRLQRHQRHLRLFLVKIFMSKDVSRDIRDISDCF